MLPRRRALSSLVGTALVSAAACAAAQPADQGALVTRGQRLFLRCASCHDASGSAIAKMGPELKGVVGRPVASFPGYGYSASLSALKFTWDESHLDAWLEKPTSIAPGTTMAFEGMPSAADRAAVVAFLRAQKP